MRIDIDDNFEAVMKDVWRGVSETSAQYRESRKLWFCAVHWCLCVLSKVAEEDEKEADKTLKDLRRQIRAFTKLVETENKEGFRE